MGDFVFIWTRPEVAVPEFGRLMAGEMVSERQLLADVDAFCAEVERCASRYRHALLATWTQPAFLSGHPLVDARPGARAHALATLNLRLMSTFGRQGNVTILDAARWQSAAGFSAHDPRAWYLNQVAMARPVLIEAARDVRMVVAALAGQQRKLLVLAAADASWRLDARTGSRGQDVAWEDFQLALRELRSCGTRLAMLGEVGRSTPGQVAAVDEVASLRELIASSRVGLNEVVYVDSREAARKRVREGLPGVYVPEWPSDRLLYAAAVRQLRCFGVDREVPNVLAAAQ
jgi:predicted enzyme involved in methoxymalonyl-ACP biosynthesis